MNTTIAHPADLRPVIGVEGAQWQCNGYHVPPGITESGRDGLLL